MQPLFGDQLLVSVFAQYVGSSFMISTESDIIKAFYLANNSGKYDELFKNYAFDNDGIEVHSYALEEAIDSLQQTRLLGRLNPDLKEYKIQNSVQIRFEKFIKNTINESTQRLIKELAKDINTELSFKQD